MQINRFIIAVLANGLFFTSISFDNLHAINPDSGVTKKTPPTVKTASPNQKKKTAQLETDPVLKLVKGLENSDIKIRTSAVETLGEMGTKASRAVPALIKTLNTSFDFECNSILKTLVKIGEVSIPAITQLINEASESRRALYLEELSKLGAEGIPAVDTYIAEKEQLESYAAICSESENGVPLAIIKSSDTYKKLFPIILKNATDYNDPVAQRTIGYMYASGKGIETSPTDAADWYRKASERGDVIAQLNLGDMYANGSGVVNNSTEAAKFYAASALKGNNKAQRELARMYENGDGVEKNHAEAVNWYKKSAAQGNTLASADLKRIPPLSLQEVIGGVTPVSAEEIRGLGFISNLDVLNYYHLGDQYDTELKRKLFRETQEYTDKYKELESLKRSIGKRKYFYGIDLAEFRSGYNWFRGYEYNLDKGGFILSVHKAQLADGTSALKIKDVFLPQVPLKQDCPGNVWGCDPYLLAPVNEEIGLRVENSGRSPNDSNYRHVVYVYVLFDLSRVDGEDGSISLVAGGTRILLANTETGEIYFDKTY